jgi:hypothetical protein
MIGSGRLMLITIDKVHFDSPMNPLELEMYHQIKNVIGVNPTFYEYIFTVDADTTVEEYALNRLVSAYVVSRRSDSAPLMFCGVAWFMTRRLSQHAERQSWQTLKRLSLR